MKILIDGYNLIFAWGWMPSTGSAHAAELARTRLIEKLKQLIPVSIRGQFTIVFDVKSTGKSKPVRRDETALGQSGFQIQFAYDYPDADTLIEELIRKEVAPQHLAVVSTDQRLRSATERRRSWSIRSEEFLDCVPEIVEQCRPDFFEPGVEPAETDSVDVDAADADSFNRALVDSRRDQMPDPKQSEIAELEAIDWLAEFGFEQADNNGINSGQTESDRAGGRQAESSQAAASKLTGPSGHASRKQARKEQAGIDRAPTSNATPPPESISETQLDELVDRRLKKRQ